MNRSDIVRLLAQQFTHLTDQDMELAVDGILDAMSHALVRGHRIEVRGFGSFKVVDRPARMGRNPRTGEPVSITKRRSPLFKVGRALRTSLDDDVEER